MCHPGQGRLNPKGCLVQSKFHLSTFRRVCADPAGEFLSLPGARDFRVTETQHSLNNMVSSCGPKAAAPRARLPSPPRLYEPRPKSCPAMLPHCSGQIFPIPAVFLSSTLRIWNSRSSAQKDFVVTLLLLVSKKGGGGEGPEPLMVFWLLCATSPVQELCLTEHSCGWMGREGKWREWRRWMLIPQALGSCWSQQRMVTASPQHQEPGGRGFSSLLANESHFPASGRGWQQH